MGIFWEGHNETPLTHSPLGNFAHGVFFSRFIFQLTGRRWCSESHGAWWANRPEVCVVLQEVLLQLGQDVLAVGVLPEGGDVGPDLVHQNLALAGLRDVDHLLDHVVGVLVLHHDVEGGGRAVRVGRADLLDQDGTLGPGGVLHALLHHVAGELVLGQVQHFPPYSSNCKRLAGSERLA